MNWKKIKEDHPKAYKKLEKHFNNGMSMDSILNGTGWNSFCTFGDLRDLYDFFDSQGIYVYLDPCGCHNPPIWNYCILITIDEKFLVNKEELTRTEAEKAAFEAAFKLLNEMK